MGKVFQDPGTLAVANESSIHRSAGLVADGYISGAKVFHDLNENGIFDEGIDVSVQSQNNGSFSGLHGDVAKPLVAIGGVDTSTGLPFQSKHTDGSFSDIVLYSAANATVINPLTSLVFKMEKQNQNAEILTFDFDNSSSTFSANINNSVVNTNLYDLKIIFSNGANDVDSYVLSSSVTETIFQIKLVSFWKPSMLLMVLDLDYFKVVLKH